MGNHDPPELVSFSIKGSRRTAENLGFKTYLRFLHGPSVLNLQRVLATCTSQQRVTLGSSAQQLYLCCSLLTTPTLHILPVPSQHSPTFIAPCCSSVPAPTVPHSQLLPGCPPPLQPIFPDLDRIDLEELLCPPVRWCLLELTDLPCLFLKCSVLRSPQNCLQTIPEPSTLKRHVGCLHSIFSHVAEA